MPGFNQKGPMGQGPMTGRRMGRCTNFGANPKDQPVAENEDASNLAADNLPAQGLGLGRGRGLGLGRGQGGAGFGRGGGGRGMGRQNRNRGGF
jgi:hypothetical protein